MATGALNLPLIVIAGPTASGKTSLAIKLAKQYGGEIICADSRTIYKHMNVGTAKPTMEERCDVPHWGLDLVEPGDPYSAAQFKEYATQKIAEIRKRGHIPFLVGGTGLYIDGIVFDFQFANPVNSTTRQQLEKMSISDLHQYCKKNNIQLPENKYNARYVIRTIQRSGRQPTARNIPISDVFVVGIATKTEELRSRIKQRAEQLFSDNVVEEATKLGKKYGWDSEAMTGNIYALTKKYIRGEINNNELKQLFVFSDWHLAKRQMTWLRRNPYIEWCKLESAEHYLSQILAGYVDL